MALNTARLFPLALLGLMYGPMHLSGSYAGAGLNLGTPQQRPRRKRRKFKGWQRELRRRK